jgi:hypothetical protein
MPKACSAATAVAVEGATGKRSLQLDDLVLAVDLSVLGLSMRVEFLLRLSLVVLGLILWPGDARQREIVDVELFQKQPMLLIQIKLTL